MSLSHGSPDFTFYEGPEAIVVADEFETRLIWLNEGTSGVGVQVLVWGEAIARSLIQLRDVSLETQDGSHRFPFEERETKDGGILVANAPDWEIFASVAMPECGPVSSDKLAEFGRSMLSVIVRGRVQRSGSETLVVALSHVGAETMDPAEIQIAASLSAPDR